MKLEGTTSSFPLHELIDMIVYSSVTGVLNIYAVDLSGYLYFRDGHLYHVDAGTAEGVDALAVLLERPQANFAFVSDPTVDRETLWGDHEQYLRMAERLASRWIHVRPHVSHLELIPLLLVPAEQLQRVVYPAHLPLLEAINGRRTLLDLAQELSWASIDVAEALVQLIADRQVELKAAPSEDCAPFDDRSDDKRFGAGIFDRMRHQNSGIRRVGHEAPVAPPNADEFVLRVLRG